jgi:thiol:disulfide interchange protein DsbC
MKRVIKEREDIVFFIKMFPLKIHPAAYRKAKTIVCEKSLRLLEDAFEGRSIPDPECDTTEIDDNIKLAERLGITGTPTIILPDGAVLPGYKNADTLIKFIEQAGNSLQQPEEETEEEAGETPESETEVEEDTEVETDTGLE